MLSVTLLALQLSTPALAEDSEFVGTEEAGQKFETTETSVSAELGGSYASGNVEYVTVNGGVNASHRWDRNKLSGGALLNTGRAIADTDADGKLDDAERAAGMVESARRYAIEARYDRFLSERNSLYVLAGAFVDPFAGYDLRSHEQIGYSRLFVDAEQTKFVGEIGFDYAQENYVDGVDPNYADIFAARVMLGLKHSFNESVTFEDVFELYENVVDLDDLRILNTASLSSKLSDTFSLKLSHSLIYDNVPVEGFRELDQVTMITLVATLI